MKRICKISTAILAILVVLAFPQQAYSIEIPEKAYGIISIPCLNIKMPVYISEYNDIEHKQAIIDEEQSALIDNWGTAYNICDHAFSEDENKNEWNIQKIFCGAYAWLYTHEANYYLECYMTGKTEYDGNEYINNIIITPCSSYDIMLSCCAEDSSHHFIACFKRLCKY